MVRHRRARRSMAFIVLASGWFVLTGGPSSASCAAPTVSVTPKTVAAGDRLVVSGDYWITTCNDTPGGCERAPTDPYRGILVTIVRANGMGPDSTLGTVDAIDDEFTFRLEARVPDLSPGDYLVTAMAAHPRYEARPPAKLHIT